MTALPVSQQSRSDMDEYLMINVPQARQRFYFFLGLVTALGVLTFLQDPKVLPGHVFIAGFTLLSVLLGFLAALGKVKCINIVGLLLSTALLIRAVSLAMKMFSDSGLSTAGTWVAMIAWIGFWNSFTVNWTYLIEPYLLAQKKIFNIPVYRVKDLEYLMEGATPIITSSQPIISQGETNGDRSKGPGGP